jgi:hypothetical protein
MHGGPEGGGVFPCHRGCACGALVYWQKPLRDGDLAELMDAYGPHRAVPTTHVSTRPPRERQRGHPSSSPLHNSLLLPWRHGGLPLLCFRR